MNSASAFTPRAIAMLLAMLTLAAICSLVPRPAHATIGPIPAHIATGTNLGPIQRINAALALEANQVLPVPPANDTLRVETVQIRTTYTINTLDMRGVTVKHHIVIDCGSGDMVACLWATNAAKAMGYYHNPSRGRKEGKLSAYCTTANAHVICSGPLGGDLNSAIAKAKATANKK